LVTVTVRVEKIALANSIWSWTVHRGKQAGGERRVDALEPAI
jgi:hypothetical protein